MKNRQVGVLIIFVTLIFLIVVISFNNALENIVNENCDHGVSCPMQLTLKTQKIISYSLIFLLFFTGLLITFTKQEITISNRYFDRFLGFNKKKLDLEKLGEEEKVIIKEINKSEGSIYQSELINKTNHSKVKITRILDKLEGKNLIDRKRRGMTNIIIAKYE